MTSATPMTIRMTGQNAPRAISGKRVRAQEVPTEQDEDQAPDDRAPARPPLVAVWGRRAPRRRWCNRRRGRRCRARRGSSRRGDVRGPTGGRSRCGGPRRSSGSLSVGTRPGFRDAPAGGRLAGRERRACGARGRPARDRTGTRCRRRRPARPAIGAGRRLGDDDGHHDVEQEEQAPGQEHEDQPDDPDERRVEVEALGDAAGDAGEDPLVARAIEPVVHVQPPDGIELDAPGVGADRQLDLDPRRFEARGGPGRPVLGQAPLARSCSRPGTSSTGSAARRPTARRSRGSRH